MTFRVGQKVVCVDANAHGIYEFPLVKGQIYTVANIADRRGTKYIDVEGVRSSLSHRPAWYAKRFRPVRETSIEIFRAMLVNPPREIVGA